jgi:hypothetical protein
MSDNTLTCANEGCETTFEQKTHNQKYCCDECCRLATNRRIMEKYYAKRDQRQGKARYCKQCGLTKLSRYNDSLVCGPCKVQKEVSANNSVMAMIASASLAS